MDSNVYQVCFSRISFVTAQLTSSKEVLPQPHTRHLNLDTIAVVSDAYKGNLLK